MPHPDPQLQTAVSIARLEEKLDALIVRVGGMAATWEKTEAKVDVLRSKMMWITGAAAAVVFLANLAAKYIKL